MLILASITDKLQVVTGSAGNIQVHVSWMDNVAGAVGPGRTNTPAITTATITDVVAPPASGVFRNIKTVHIRNTAATLNDITLRHTDGTIAVELYKTSLVAGGTLSYIDEIGFFFGQAGAGGGGSGGTTGDAKLTIKSVADTGWVMMNDGSIGGPTSNATTRANVDCLELFKLFFNNLTDAWAPLQNSSGVGVTRGSFANADAAWTANSRVLLTRVLGRSLTIAGAGSGLTASALGQFDGEETHVISAAEMTFHGHGISDPSHAHAVSDPTHSHLAANADAFIVANLAAPQYSIPGPSNYLPYSYGQLTASATGIAIAGAFTGVTVAAAGGSAPMNIRHPRSFWNIMIKL
jgi:microcystin-dependent protein